MIRNWRTVSTFILVFIFFHACLAAAENNQSASHRLRFGIEAHDYQWKEYDDTNAKLVDEYGYLFGVTCDFDSGREILGWRSGGALFGGHVNYKGVTWTHKKVKTNGFNLGARLYLDAVPNYRLKFGLWLKSFIGIGFKGWLRDLNDTHTQEGTAVSGTKEWWGTIYGRIGAGASYPISKTVEIFSEAGSKIPIYTVNHANINISGNSYVNIKPEMKFSPFADLGVRWKQLTVKLYYDTLWFDKSDTEAAGLYEVYQPESESDIIGVNVAWVWMF